MRCDWLKMVGAGVATAFLVLPVSAQGVVTKAELMQKAQQHRALTTGRVTPKVSAAKVQSAKQQKKELHSQKSALIKERRALAKQGDRRALDANHAKLAAVNAGLKVAKKGGAKK